VLTGIGKPPPRQLTVEGVTREIESQRRTLEHFQSQCDKTIAEHGSPENERRYNHQVTQRKNAILGTSRKLAYKECAPLHQASTDAMLAYSKASNAQMAAQRERAAKLRAQAEADRKAAEAKGIGGWIAGLAGLGQSGIASVLAAMPTKGIISGMALEMTPELKALYEKKKAAYDKARMCSQSAAKRIQQELEAQTPMPHKGDSPCGKMPTPSRTGIHRFQQAKVQQFRGLGNLGSQMTMPHHLRYPTKNLTCCPTDNKWHEHPNGTFYECPPPRALSTPTVSTVPPVAQAVAVKGRRSSSKLIILVGLAALTGFFLASR
jgi:hypothetical protein